MLAYGFGQRALLGGLMIALTCSLLSFFVVVRRLSFAGEGIAHAAFGGVAIGILGGFSPVVAAAGFCVLIALGIGWFSRKGHLHEDTVIGILFTAAIAMGVVLVRMAHAYNVDLMSYLFGSILAMSWVDVAVLGVFSALAITFLVVFFKELLFVAFDEETATASGVPVRFAYYGLLVTIALVVVVSIKLVGIVLVSALLVIPGAAGMQMARNYRGVIAVSMVAGTASVVAGLFLSSSFDVASGAAIVLVLFGAFLVTVALSPRRQYIQRLVARMRRAGD